MAANLKWLVEIKYPNNKIIVWTHNRHVSKFSGHYQKKFLNELNTMGNVFTEDALWLNKTYIIGFTSYEGYAGRVFDKIKEVPKLKGNGFENWINKGFQYAFVDFKNFNFLYPFNNENFYMKCSLTGPYHRNEIAQWNRVFDGVFFIKNTYPCN